MSGGREYWYDKHLEEANRQGIAIHNKEAADIGLSPYKHTIAKNIRLLLSEHKATLPFYYAAMMQQYVDELFEKEVVNGEN